MRLQDVHSIKFENRGFGYCVIWCDNSCLNPREIVLNGEGLRSRIHNLRKQGLETSFEEYALAEVDKLDAWNSALTRYMEKLKLERLDGCFYPKKVG
jgi:hypothetical protein